MPRTPLDAMSGAAGAYDDRADDELGALSRVANPAPNRPAPDPRAPPNWPYPQGYPLPTKPLPVPGSPNPPLWPLPNYQGPPAHHFQYRGEPGKPYPSPPLMPKTQLAPDEEREFLAWAHAHDFSDMRGVWRAIKALIAGNGNGGDESA